MNSQLNIQEAINFLYGQLELYKIEFSETDNNKYFEVMGKLNNTINVIRTLNVVIEDLAIEKRKLTNELKTYKEVDN